MDRHWDDYLYRQYLRRRLYSRCALPQQHLRRATRPSVLRRWQELSHREPSLCQRRPLPRYGLPPRPSLGRRPLRSRKCALFEPGDRFRSPAASRAKSRRVRRAPSAQPPPTVETGPRPSADQALPFGWRDAMRDAIADVIASERIARTSCGNANPLATCPNGTSRSRRRSWR